MKKLPPPATPLRNASSPFTIPLGRDDYFLTREALQAVTDERIMKMKDWYSPKLKVINLKKATVKLKAVFIRTTCTLVIAVEKDKLHVSCSCGNEVETLCIHAYTALNSKCWSWGTDYFRQFRPAGLYELSLKHKQYFRRGHNHYDRDIDLKKNLGAVYLLSDTTHFEYPVNAMTIPGNETKQDNKKSEVLCYMIVNFMRKDHPPCVMPCMGRLNNAGTAIKNFLPFLSGVQKEYEPILTAEQKLLNEECFALYKKAEQLPGRLFSRYCEETADITQYAGYFSAWEKILPELMKQPYVFTTHVHIKRDLKGKPAKSHSEQVRLSPLRWQLSFRLADKGTFFQLSMHEKFAGKIISRYEVPMLFFRQDKENNLYLSASSTDTYITEWIRRTGNRITIFKEHYKDFENNFLRHLQTRYEVIQVKACKKKQTGNNKTTRS